MKSVVFLVLIFGFYSRAGAQKVIADTSYPVRSAMRISQLVHVSEHPETGNLKLVFRQANQINSRSFYHYEFSPRLELLAAEVEENDYTNDEYLKKVFPNYRGEFFIEEGFAMQQSMRLGDRQKIEMISYTDSYTWNWFFRDYFVQRRIGDARMVEKLQDEKYYLVHQFYHAGVDKVFALIAFKEKGKVLLTSGSGNRPLLEHYQLLCFDRDLNMEILRDWVFPYKMELVLAKKLDWNDDEHFLGQEKIYQYSDPSAEMIFVFAPAGGLFTGNKNPEKGEWNIVKLNADGGIKEIPVSLPGSGWKVMDVLHRNDTILLWGPAKNNRYHNDLPGDPPNEISADGMRYRGFQMLRIAGDKVDQLSYRHFKEFRQKADKQSKRWGIAYRGRDFLFSYAKMGVGGELFVGGQRIVESEIREQGGGEHQSRTVKVRNGYRQPVLFCFNPELELERVYGYKYYRWLMRDNDAVSPMWVRRSEQGKWYWEVSELYAVRTFGYATPLFNDNHFLRIFGPNIYSSMNKYLFFPRLSPIDPESGIMKEPVNIGVNEKGKQRFYSDNFIPWKTLKDGSILYIGFDQNYSRIWLGRVLL